MADRPEEAEATGTRVNDIDEIRVRGIQPVTRVLEIRRLERWSSRIESRDAGQLPRHVATRVSGHVGTQTVPQYVDIVERDLTLRTEELQKRSHVLSDL